MVGATALLASFLAGERPAHACGGCFTPPTPTETESVITDEKMVLSISMNQTTLYDQINYSGNPASFAWVLPIKGTVTVGLSADVLFQVINQLTATEVQAPPTNCPSAPSCGCPNFGAGVSAGAAAADGGTLSKDGVVITSQAQVGPYETVQLHSTNGNGSALNAWLTSHGYSVPANTQPIIDSYVHEGFDFLALKLVPGAGVQSMQPVRVTSLGASPTLPLHMVAIGTGPTTGITIWVVADSRWQPTNFPTFTIDDSEIAWDWATESSNYEALRLSKEAKYGGRGWQIESSLDLSQYSIQQTVVQNVEYGSPVGGYAPPAQATADGGVDAAPQDAGEAAAQVLAANLDLSVLFAGIAAPNARVTRMRSDVAQSALSVDMALGAAADPSELTNIHTATKEIGEPLCPIYSTSNCGQVTGTAPRSVAQAGASSESGGCSTAQPRTPTAPALTGLLALVGLGVLRLRKRAG